MSRIRPRRARALKIMLKTRTEVAIVGTEQRVHQWPDWAKAAVRLHRARLHSGELR
jgi:uncharacterized protein YecE (DUF72 family)